MTAYFIRRLLLIIPTFLGVTMVIFAVTRMVPGGPFDQAIQKIRMGGGGGEGGGGMRASGELSPDVIAALKKQFRLDMPGYQAYFLWLGDLVRFDLGRASNGTPVAAAIADRIPISLTFGLTGFLLAYLICIPLGIAKALRHGSRFDLFTSAVVFIGYSIPGWALGTLLILFLSSGRFYDAFPLGGIQSQRYQSLPAIVQSMEDPEELQNDFGEFQWERMSFLSRLIDLVWHLALPVFCFMLIQFAVLTVITKNSLMENLGQDYVRTAFAKGLAPRRVIYLHTLRNSLIPLVTGLGSALSLLMAGSYLIEYVFDINGLGKFGFNAIQDRDYGVVMGVLSINTLLALFGNLLSDVLYAVVDPRIRFK